MRHDVTIVQYLERPKGGPRIIPDVHHTEVRHNVSIMQYQLSVSVSMDPTGCITIRRESQCQYHAVSNVRKGAHRSYKMYNTPT